MPLRQVDAGQLGDKIAEIVRIAARRLTENEEDVEKTATYVRQRVHTAVNESLDDHKMLRAAERAKIGELRKRANHLKKIIEERDQDRTAELQERYGKHYIDFQRLELNAIEWAIEFIEERSL